MEFLGHRPRKEALDLLATADIFAQPSLFEGHSLALIEAAKLELPLIVSDVPVQIEGITASDGTRCGVAVGVNDDIALSDAIRRLCESETERQEAVRLSRHLSSEITFRKMADQYVALLNASLAGRH